MMKTAAQIQITMFLDNDDITYYDEIENDGQLRYLQPSINITSIRAIVKCFRKSPVRNNILQNYVKEQEGKELRLLIDCNTRWNTLITMIERFLKIQRCVDKALRDLNRSHMTENLSKTQLQNIIGKTF